MNNKKMMYVIFALCALLLTSACSTESDKGANKESNQGSTTDTVTTQPFEPSDSIDNEIKPTESTKQTEPTEPTEQTEPVKPIEQTEPTETNQENSKPQKDNSAESDNEILVIIDQTPKPIEGNSFDFVVKQIPEGYSLAELQWISKDNMIVNSVQEAIEHGANGGEGFYISGNGQYSGFFYRDSMKGEEGQIVILFKNGQGKELTWKKKITLT